MPQLSVTVPWMPMPAMAPQTPYTPRDVGGSMTLPQSVELGVGVPVTISGKRFQIIAPLGMGSYGMVWRAGGEDRSDVAIKEILCKSQGELDNAHFEGDLLFRLCNPSADDQLDSGGENRNDPRIPALVAQETEVMGEQDWRVRLAMARIPGMPLMLLLEQHRLQRMNGDSPETQPQSADSLLSSLTEPCRFAWELVAQLAPTLERISTLAYHRDVNPRNILIDAGDDGGLKYGLVDFGMAVDALHWRGAIEDGLSSGNQDGAWTHLEVGGDCRYWPVSAWIMFLHGPQELPPGSALRSEYQTGLDLHALGITALQVLIELSPHAPRGFTETSDASVALVQAFGALQTAWDSYWRNASEFWRSLIDCFTTSGDWNSLKAACIKVGVQEIISRDLSELRSALNQVSAACGSSAGGTNKAMLQGFVAAVRAMLTGGAAGHGGTGLSDREPERPPIGAAWGTVYAAMGLPPSQLSGNRRKLGTSGAASPSRVDIKAANRSITLGAK